MAALFEDCTGQGRADTGCLCDCHVDAEAPCNTAWCAPVTAQASDNIRVKHTNRNSDAGKRTTKRGARSLRRA